MKRPKINSQDLADKLFKDLGFNRKTARELVDRISEYIAEALIEGKDVQIQGLGKFRTTELKARKRLNHVTKEMMDTPATVAVRFRSFVGLRQAINSTRSKSDANESVGT